MATGEELSEADDHSSAVQREAREDRQGLLERLFDHIAEVRARERAELGEQFELAEIDRVPAHSPLLGKAAEVLPPALTLSERVQRLLSS